MEVSPGIHRIQAPLGNRFVCVFALVGQYGTLIVDTGMRDTPETYIAPYFRDHGLDLRAVRYVLVTHADYDHNGGNGTLRAMAPNAIYLCHELDRAQIADTRVMIRDRYNDWEKDHGFASDPATDQWIMENVSDIPIDVGLTGGETLTLGPDWTLELLHTPGHSFGHMTVWDPRSKTAVIADASLYNSVLTTEGQPAFPPTYRYLATYQATIQRLLGMDIDLLLTSHYPVYRGTQVKEFLAESLAYTQRVDSALADTLRAGGDGMTLKEIIAAVHQKIGSWPPGAEMFLNFPLTGHLEQMEASKRLERGRRGELVTYRWVSA